MDNADLNLKIVQASFVVKNTPLSRSACALLNDIIGKVQLNTPVTADDNPIIKLQKQINGKQFNESEDNANLLALIIPIMEDRYDDIKINCNLLDIKDLINITSLQKNSSDEVGKGSFR